MVSLPKATLLALLAAVTASTGASASDAVTWFEQAMRHDEEGNATLAFAQYRRAAEAGLPQAEFNVAAMLDSGRGTAQDIGQAAAWYARAAARGNTRAAYNLGQLYESGQGVPRNLDVARAWFAASGLAAARTRIAALPARVPESAELSAPTQIIPSRGATVAAQPDGVELVWTAPPQPEPVAFFVEICAAGASEPREVFSTFASTTSVLALVPGARGDYLWRVFSIARGSKRYAASPWSNFTVAD